MPMRQNALNEWIEAIVDNQSFTLTPLAGDASFRRYFRLCYGGITRIVMDAPPERESIRPFIDIGHRLTQGGVLTPQVLAVDLEQGFALLEDMGDQLLLDALSSETASGYYKTAMSTLLRIQQCQTTDPLLPVFDKTFMNQELAVFREWFLHAYLCLELSTEEERCLHETFDWLTTQIMSQPQVFVHRDYHSRNLMLIGDNPVHLSVIDFQDAMIGPITYDLVSLLKDCYIQWPREQVAAWLMIFYNHLPLREIWSLTAFTRAFDFCGLQRHLKVLGIFARLHLRDNKSSYLRDLPLVLNYTMSCLETYDELRPLHHFMQERVRLP